MEKNVFNKHVEFTKRELDVIMELFKGCSNAEIAENLGIKIRTVKTHLERLYAKLGIHNRVDLILYAHHNRIQINKYLDN